MAKTVGYELEGAVLEIPLRWDELARKDIEDYGPFLEESPFYTPAGCPILLTIEDACPHAEMVDNDPTSIDCGACKHFWQPPRLPAGGVPPPGPAMGREKGGRLKWGRKF